MTKELRFIERYEEIEKEIKDLSLEGISVKNEVRRENIESKIGFLKEEQSEIEKELIESESNSATLAKLKNLKSQLREIIEHLRPDNSGHSISRNQGIGIDNFIVTLIRLLSSRNLKKLVL